MSKKIIIHKKGEPLGPISINQTAAGRETKAIKPVTGRLALNPNVAGNRSTFPIRNNRGGVVQLGKTQFVVELEKNRALYHKKQHLVNLQS